MFAEVAVPIYVRQTFTYRLPGDMAARAKPGCRVLAPFGKKFLTGFIVDLHESPKSEVDEADIKDVEELLDESPIITSEILELTRWVSDYYFAPWGECLRAALPAGATTISEQVLSLTEKGRAALREGQLPPSKLEALQPLAASDFVEARQFGRRLSRPRAAALVRQLERDGLIALSQRIGETQMKPRLQNVVKLTSPGGLGGGRPAVVGSEKADPQRTGQRRRAKHEQKELAEHELHEQELNQKQLRVVETLESAGDPMPFSDLLGAAEVSASVVRTLEKRGVVEVFARELRRDPLAHIAPDDAHPVRLTGEQQLALDQIVAKLEERQYATFLLHGITGSGKPEI